MRFQAAFFNLNRPSLVYSISSAENQGLKNACHYSRLSLQFSGNLLSR
ncbi:hypothetical protein GCWU000324_00234 [Kingella oralis ATCC 51147]|uniref:Uncharacterized protein n=1 Tax=Kingella oralis ATCC 51147 TaxID=629741 RepID=C4GHA2_9NEIS|nr:hypothetical protein GCWU000324_00234 [Kingella oralis ATCC 51147]